MPSSSSGGRRVAVGKAEDDGRFGLEGGARAVPMCQWARQVASGSVEMGWSTRTRTGGEKGGRAGGCLVIGLGTLADRILYTNFTGSSLEDVGF